MHTCEFDHTHIKHETRLHGPEHVVDTASKRQEGTSHGVVDVQATL